MSKTDEDLIIELFEAFGAKQFKPALLPQDLQRGPIGNCFDWCALQAAQHRSYIYVEGIAKPFNEDDWILHAWLSDGEHAFDPTWQATDNETGKEIAGGFEYIGLPMDILNVHAFMKATGYQGVIANRWRHPQLADKCFEGV